MMDQHCLCQSVKIQTPVASINQGDDQRLARVKANVKKELNEKSRNKNYNHVKFERALLYYFQFYKTLLFFIIMHLSSFLHIARVCACFCTYVCSACVKSKFTENYAIAHRASTYSLGRSEKFDSTKDSRKK
jgi:hypothetical protein